MAAAGFVELLRLADRARRRARGDGDIAQNQWSGVAFKLGDLNLIAPLGEVSEVLTLPELYSVPLTKSWMVGIANVRGRLLPIADLAQYLQVKQHRHRLDQRKVLVMDEANVFSGLLVDRVIGIQHFMESQYHGVNELANQAIGQYTHGMFVKENQKWYIFMPSKLAQDAQYLNAAV